jgi:F420-dependent oxidoreductase-like protein
MKIAMPIDYSRGFERSVASVVELERRGLDQVWVAEAYGFDAPSQMGYLAARTERVEIAAGILPIYTRTPSLLAMTAAGVDSLSGGRVILGLGASGPQVIEGFHGLPYDRPLARTREIIEICRQVWRRKGPVTHDGPVYHLPLPPEQGTGLGKSLKLINHPVRDQIPVWVAALGEKNVAMTAEIANGWLPVFFLPDRARKVFGPALDAGTARRDPALGPLEIAAGGMCAIGEEADVAPIRELGRSAAALYIGGMGAKGRNFYNALVSRYGFEQEAELIQDLYLAGHKAEAAAKVPTELLESLSLCGPESYIKDRIAAYADAGVTVLNVNPIGPEPARIIEQLKEWTS